MTPRDRLQRLLFEHRTAHDQASSEREILAMFEAERERWKVMMREAIAKCFDQFARNEVMSDPNHFAAEALRVDK